MKNSLRCTVAGVAITGAALSGTFGISALGAGEASAKIDSGKYTWTTTKTLTGARGAYPVTIRGNVLRLNLLGTIIGASKHARLHPTRTGAWMDYGGNQYVFVRKGNRYTGQELLFAINGAVVGTTSLTPRR